MTARVEMMFVFFRYRLIKARSDHVAWSGQWERFAAGPST